MAKERVPASAVQRGPTPKPTAGSWRICRVSCPSCRKARIGSPRCRRPPAPHRDGKGKKGKASREVSGSGCEQTSEGKIPWMPAGRNKPARYGNEARRGRKNPGRAASWTPDVSDGEGGSVSDGRNERVQRLGWPGNRPRKKCRADASKGKQTSGRDAGGDRPRSAGSQTATGESQRPFRRRAGRPTHRANDPDAWRG